jgi:hypothetical protein
VSVCARCASEDEDLESVWPLAAADADSEEPELWCVMCRQTHPHEPVGDEEADADA